MIDIVEQELAEISKKLFNILLFDRTTRKNICWATDDYISYGEAYGSQEPITKDLITGKNSDIIRPRVLRSLDEKRHRTRDKAEVFTPSWVCNKQNNLIDYEWFGRENVFNTENGDQWTVTASSVSFDGCKKGWQKYVDARRIEVTCGEAPYLVSRYDTVTGEKIPLESRIGILDRKMRVVKENTDTQEDWLKWSQRAFESVYGYEFQGDSLLLARENLLYSYIEYYYERFNQIPEALLLRKIARIISWNIWQMDGLKCVVPFSCKPIVNQQFGLFVDSNDNETQIEQCPGCVSGDIMKHTGKYCKIMDWRSNNSRTFLSMIKRGR